MSGNKLFFLILLTLTVSIFFCACKKEEDNSNINNEGNTSTDEVTSETLPEASSEDTLEGTGNIPESALSMEETASPEEPGQSSDIPDVTFAPNDQVIGEEATAFESGEEVIPAENSTEAKKNSIVLQKEGKDCYRLTIDKMEFTDERNPYEAAAEQVMVVTFTYENFAIDSNLFIGSTRFHMADEDGLACSPYALMESSAESMPIGIGESYTAAVAFAVPGESSDVTLYYTDFNLGENAEYSFQSSNFQQK